MICPACKDGALHYNEGIKLCPGDKDRTWCDCQHKTGKWLQDDYASTQPSTGTASTTS